MVQIGVGVEFTDGVVDGSEIPEYDPAYDPMIFGHSVETCGSYEGGETIAFGYSSALHDTTLTARDSVTG